MFSGGFGGCFLVVVFSFQGHFGGLGFGLVALKESENANWPENRKSAKYFSLLASCVCSVYIFV